MITILIAAAIVAWLSYGFRLPFVGRFFTRDRLITFGPFEIEIRGRE